MPTKNPYFIDHGIARKGSNQARSVEVGITVPKIDRVAVETARAAEKQLGAYCPSGCYWEDPLLDATSLAKIDALWSTAWRVSRDLGACWCVNDMDATPNGTDASRCATESPASAKPISKLC